MGGGLMQLVAYGAQDIYLTGNPQITFFKVVYRRHTNFSMETIQQTINGTPSPSGSSTVTISRNGDLVYKIYVTSESAVDDVTDGTKLISEVELEIGGQRIDRHYSEWMNLWNELSTPESKAVGLKAMQGAIGTSGSAGAATGVGTVQVPLQFWFCRNPGLALPLIALQYHEVKLKFTWGANADCGGGIEESKVMCDYIYLDTDERRRFAQVSHEYLIEQLQKEDKSTTSTTHKLNFNHPVKELIWTTGGDEYTKAHLKLNGHDRFALQDTEYFQLRQPFDYHTAVPKQNLPSAAQIHYSFIDTNKCTDVGGDLTADSTTTGVSDNPAAQKFVIGGLSAAAIGAAAALVKTETAITAGDPNTQALLFLNATATTLNFKVGHLYEIIGHGTSWAGGGETAATKSSITASCTGVVVGAAADDGEVAGEVGPGTTFVTFNTFLVDVLSATVDGTDLTITSIREITTEASGVSEARTSAMTNKINVYSFGLKPEEHQPSGTCNFSRIDTAQLVFSATDTCTVYAVNYNVLRIMSGMGGLAYSN
jgi:hypothetical protein